MRRACGLQQRLCSGLLCAARLDAGAHSQHETRRRGSRARSRSPRTAAVTFSKRQSALPKVQLHGQVSGGLRNVKGAGSASGDMLYNIGPATTVEQRRPGPSEPWGFGGAETPGLLLAHLPTSHRTIAASNKGNGGRGGGQDKGRRKAGVAVKSERNTCTNSRSSGLVWVWLLCAALRCSGTKYGRALAVASGSLGGWSYFGAQQTCGPDYSP